MRCDFLWMKFLNLDLYDVLIIVFTETPANMVQNCAYQNCKVDSRRKEAYMKDVKFFPIPKPLRNLTRCQAWLNAINNDTITVSTVKYYHYVCSLHFLGGNGPTEECPDPLRNYVYKEEVVSNNTKPTNNASGSPKVLTLLKSRIRYSKEGSIEYQPNLTVHVVEETVIPENKMADSRLDENHQTDPKMTIHVAEGTLIEENKVVDTRLDENHLVDVNVIHEKTISHKHVTYNQLKQCSGIRGTLFQPLHNTKISDGYFCSKTQAIRSSKCEKVFNGWKTERCIKCAFFRINLLKRIKRRKNGTFSKKTKNCLLDSQQLITKIAGLKKKKKALNRKVKELKGKIQKSILKNAIIVPEDLSQDLENTLATNPLENPDAFQRILIKQQLDLIKTNRKRPKKWHPALIHWCLFLKSKSPSSYETLRKVLKLPCKRTLFEYSKDMSTECGFNERVLSEISEKIKLETLSEHEKYLALLVDEISIKEDLIYKASTGEIVGFCQLNESSNKLKDLEKQIKEDGDNLPIATHIMQLMIRGITTSFKHPLAFFPCHKMKAPELYSIVWECLENIHLFGLKILVVVCDKAGINQKMIKMWCSTPGENDSSQPFYKANNPYSNELLYFVSDPPHLIKTTRNCVESSGNKKNTRLLLKNGKHILWDHFVQAFEKDSHAILRLASKITWSHIHLNPFSRMKVNFAAQVLSNTMATAITLIVGEPASETVKFIKMFNTFFDIVNTRNYSESKVKNNPNLAPFENANDWRLQWLEQDFLGYLQDWEDEVQNLELPKDCDRKKMLLSRDTREGLQMTVLSIVEIVPFLLKKGAKMVFTERFCQDSLERYFGKHRAATGSNDNPTVLSYQQNVKKINIISKMMVKPKNGNVKSKSKLAKLNNARRLLPLTD